MGLEHIVYRHWHSSGFADASKFGADISGKRLRGLSQEAATRGEPWNAEGFARVLETNLGRTIGTDPMGQATSWLRIVVNDVGAVITAYPIPR